MIFLKKKLTDLMLSYIIHLEFPFCAGEWDSLSLLVMPSDSFVSDGVFFY